MRITVLMGGTSSERDVSLASGLRIAEALRTRGHVVRSVDTAKGALSEDDERRMIAEGVVKQLPPTPEQLAQMRAESVEDTAARLPRRGECDVAFLALHGGSGEDGTIQALLDLAGVPYTGSGHLASALAMDKDLSKHLMRAYDVLTADWLMANDPESMPSAEDVVSTLGLPLIVKPSKQGSTVGLSIVKERTELVPAIREAFKHDDEVMLEQFIAGRELTVSILGSEALPVGEIVSAKEIYDYECKYTPGMAEEVFPAALSVTDAMKVQDLAKRTFLALKLSGCARIDFRMTNTGQFFCLEANTLPGMTATSLVPQAAAAAGIAFPELCERIAQLAVAASARPRVAS
ncbi:MAG: D-alanine--D-alanine ligase [bacterium]